MLLTYMYFRSYGIHFAVQSVNFDIFAASALKEVVALITIILLIPISKRVSCFKKLSFDEKNRMIVDR